MKYLVKALLMCSFVPQSMNATLAEPFWISPASDHIPVPTSIIRYTTYHGTLSLFHLREVSQLRERQYAAYPYLHASCLPLCTLNQDRSEPSADILVILAYHGDQLIGLVSGAPLNNYYGMLADQTSCLAQKLRPVLQEQLNSNSDCKKTYYIAEILVSERYRDQGVEKDLLRQIEGEIKNNYQLLARLAPKRQDEHPLKPADFFDTEELVYQQLGYQKINYAIQLSWLTCQSDGPACTEAHEMQLWVKQL